MRIIVHTLITLMVAAILGGVGIHHVQEKRESILRAETHAAVRRFQQQIHLQMALASESGEYAGPETIDPAWFEGNLPENPLLGVEHAWVEVAGSDERDRAHPRALVAADTTVAAFWYNPHLGVVRARVPVGISDAHALRVYNEVNASALDSLFAAE